MSRFLKLFAALCTGGVALSTLTVMVLLSTQSAGCACGPDTRGMHLRTLSLAQKAFYIENGRFATALQIETHAGPLSNISEGHQNYQMTLLENEGARDTSVPSEGIVFGSATPDDVMFYPQVGPFRGSPKPTYYSAVSAMTFDTEIEAFKGVICTATEPTDLPLAQPTYSAEGFICPDSSEETSRL
ncbi:MAG: type IV pilin-like G/H family protein [Cyanobacteria bacterium J06649_4]